MRLLGPAVGDQACGESGPGRMLEPQEIAAAVSGPTAVPDAEHPPLAGKRVMITAGPTREPLDEVRYISNRSSGKMGYALAAAARDAGADVLLVSGPVNLPAPASVQLVSVERAREMYDAVHEDVASVDIFIGTAAVADYRAAEVRSGKIKKHDDNAEMSLDLVRNPDILASVAALEQRPFTVGFAAETERLREYALGKLTAKNLDMIVANLVGADRGFDADDNTVEVFWKGGERAFPPMDKRLLADELLTLIAQRFLGGEETAHGVPAAAIGD
jgi:phosphopantothenoylcysteine decarboxylase/phosphopantothenate--cysteine ligase